MLLRERLDQFDASTPDELRGRLKALGAELYEEFSRNSRELIRRLRLRSKKALDLFKQTVSIKESGGLNEFVRQHMLERTDSAEKIAQLRATYQNLTRAHDAIAKAELARLTPLLDEATQRQQVMARIAEAERCAALTPLFFARRKMELLERASADAQARIGESRQQAATFKARVESLRRQQIDWSRCGANWVNLPRSQGYATAPSRVSKERHCGRLGAIASDGKNLDSARSLC